MNRPTRNGVAWPRLDMVDGHAVGTLAMSLDVLWRTCFTVRGSHDVVMRHLRERPTPTTEMKR